MSESEMARGAFGFRPLSNGSVAFRFATAANEAVELELTSDQLSSLVAAALKAASLSGRAVAGRSRSSRLIDRDLPGAIPDGFGVALGPRQGQSALVAHFGDATLALPFTSEQAVEVGHALLAAGATTERPAN